MQENLPILFTLNGGVWGDANGGVPDYDLTDYLELDPIETVNGTRMTRSILMILHVDGLPGSLKSPELVSGVNFKRTTTRRSENIKSATFTETALSKFYRRVSPALCWQKP